MAYKTYKQKNSKPATRTPGTRYASPSSRPTSPGHMTLPQANKKEQGTKRPRR